HEKALSDMNIVVKEDATDANLLLRAKILRVLNKPALAKTDEQRAKQYQQTTKTYLGPTIAEMKKLKFRSDDFLQTIQKADQRKAESEVLAAETKYKKASTGKDKADAAWELGNKLTTQGSFLEQSNPTKAEQFYKRSIALFEESAKVANDEENV